MILIRSDKTIHHETGEWFDSRWHFSFENYRDTDPANEHFGAMRVFNDNRVFPGGGWPLHPHRDVEALTYVARRRVPARGQRRRRTRAAPGGLDPADDARAVADPTPS